MTTVEDHVQKVKDLRLVVMPAYCYDDDENDVPVAAYLAYYGVACANECLNAIRAFIERHQAYCATRTESDFLAFLEARRQFVRLTPFCRDELDHVKSGSLEPYLAYMRSVHECRPVYHERLLAYEEHVTGLILLLERSSHS